MHGYTLNEVSIKYKQAFIVYPTTPYFKIRILGLNYKFILHLSGL